MHKVLAESGTGEIILPMILVMIFLLLIVIGPINGIIQIVKQAQKNKLN